MCYCRFRNSCVTSNSSRKRYTRRDDKELHLENEISPIYTQIAWHKDKWMTAPLRQFIDVTREFYNRLSGEIFILYKRKMAILYKEPMLACNKYRFFYVLNKGCYKMCISQLFS